MPTKTVRLESTGAVARLVLHRPQALNALNHDLARELLSGVESLESNPDIRVVILTGGGASFCSGGDVKAMASQMTESSPSFFENELQLLHRAVLGIRRSTRVYVASVRGHAAGAGFSFALACDFRFASSNARFSMAFVNLGLVPDCGATYFLPRLVGEERSKRLCISGETIDAETAAAMGLLTRVTDDEDLDRTTEEFARELAARPPLAVARIKALVQASWDGILDDQLDRETDAQVSLGRSHDFREGVRAFLKRRPGRFQGR